MTVRAPHSRTHAPATTHVRRSATLGAVDSSSRDRAAAAAAVVAVLVIGFGLLDSVVWSYLHGLLERVQQPVDLGLDFDPEAYEFREHLHEHLGFTTLVAAALTVAGGLAIAVAWWRAGGDDRRLRLWTFLAGGACLGTLVAALPQLVDVVAREPSDEPVDFAAMYQLAATFSLLSWAGAVGWVHAFARGRRHGGAALGLAAVGGLAVVPFLYVSFVAAGDPLPQWWSERHGPLPAWAWARLLGLGALGAGIALASADDDPSSHARTSQASRGLALARGLVFGRVGLGLLTLGLMLANRLGQRSRSPFEAAPEPGFAVHLVPWVGYASALLGVGIAIGIATVVVQRRSRIGAVLVAAGTIAMVLAAAISLGQTSLLHQIVSADRAHTWGLADHLKTIAYYDGYAYWSGVGGTVTTLVGLVVVARRTKRGASTLRAVRFIAMALLFVAVWTKGQAWLADVGSGFILLIPVVLFGAVWMLLDLTAFLGEVSYALQREAEPPRQDAQADGPKSWSA